MAAADKALFTVSNTKCIKLLDVCPSIDRTHQRIRGNLTLRLVSNSKELGYTGFAPNIEILWQQGKL